MNEKTDYQTMLEIPVSTCNISYKPIKRKRVKGTTNEDLKKQVLDKVNNETTAKETCQDKKQNAVEKAKKPKLKSKFNAVTCELIVIGVLIATICLTNVLNTNSAMNVFFRNVFSNQPTQNEVVDEKIYSDFTPVLANESTSTIKDGIITVSGNGSVYSPLDGKVESVLKDDDGKYSMTIAHSDNFKTVISGLLYAYSFEGDTVLKNVPVGFIDNLDYNLCFLGEDGNIIKTCSLEGNTVVWEV
ncbi:MAG: M23 family metallopeptidase [Clostridia bacterium]|nr:M23 family metallopeptidase [Clostridia bacterium]